MFTPQGWEIVRWQVTECISPQTIFINKQAQETTASASLKKKISWNKEEKDPIQEAI